MYPEGTKDVELGKVIAILVDKESDIAAFQNYSDSPAKAAPVQAEPAPVKAAAAKAYPDHVVLEMPNLSPTMEKGNIAKWLKKVGDKVKPGDALCGIETDKAVVDFEMQEDGYIAKLCYPEGAKDVPLGEPVAILVDDPKNIPAFADWVKGGKIASTSTSKAAEPVK